MMGVIILTADYRKGEWGEDVVVMRGIELLPDAENMTYISYWNGAKQKDIEYWIPHVQNRLVIVMDKLPKMTKAFEEKVIIDVSLKQGSQYAIYDKALQAMFRFQDRQYVFKLLKDCKMPIPLALTWLETNRPQNVQKWRLLADVAFTLPDEYAWSIMAFCVEPDGKNPRWPSRKAKDKENIPPTFIRDTDTYWQLLSGLDIDIRNDVRTSEDTPTEYIKGKRKEATTQWL